MDPRWGTGFFKTEVFICSSLLTTVVFLLPDSFPSISASPAVYHCWPKGLSEFTLLPAQIISGEPCNLKPCTKNTCCTFQKPNTNTSVSVCLGVPCSSWAVSTSVWNLSASGWWEEEFFPLSLNTSTMCALASRCRGKSILSYQMQRQTLEDSVCLKRLRVENWPCLFHSQERSGVNSILLDKFFWPLQFCLTVLFFSL